MKNLSSQVIVAQREFRYAILLAILVGTTLPSRAILYSDNMQYGIYTGFDAAKALAADTAFCPSFAAVGQLTDTQTVNGKVGNYSGTGTLLADPYTGLSQWVLTAAHNWNSTVSAMSFTVDGIIYQADLSSLRQNPNWNNAPVPLRNADVGPSQGWDVGLFRLSDPVPVQAASLYTSTNELGQIGYTVGFGKIGNGTSMSFNNISNDKLAMANRIDRVTAQNLIPLTKNSTGGLLAIDFDSGDPYTNTLADPGLPVLQQATNQPTVLGGGISGGISGSTSTSTQVTDFRGNLLEGSTSQGDSGGPTFIWNPNAGSYQIAGITSWGFNPTQIGTLAGPIAGLYGSLSYMTRVSRQVNWINEVMAQAGAPTYKYIPSLFQTLAVSDSLSGPGYLQQSGPGNVVLSGTNTYTGGTIISSGTLEVTNNFALGTGSVTVSGGVFLIDAGVDIGNAITLTGAGSAATVAHDVLAGDHFANTINVSSSIGGRDTDAMILSGTASHDGRLVAAFQATSLALNDDRRISDVFTLSGVPLLLDGSAKDTFTLELFVNTPLDASAFIAWLDGTGTWVNAVIGNTGGTPTFVAGAWDASYGLGTYGVDLDNNVVWAVLNHNSDFAVVPEPGTFALAALGLSSLMACCRRGRQTPGNRT